MKVEEIITNRIIEKLESGTVPWHKPWMGAENEPKNLISKKEYRGINAFLTACQGYSSPFWVSFKQAKELGGDIKKGEKGTPVIFWNWKEIDKEDGKTDKVPFMRYYTVFNVDQVEGIPAEKIPVIDAINNAIDAIDICDTMVENMPNRPEIKHAGSSAYYRPSEDIVNVPLINLFDGSQEYYSTLFHELTHSTGHKSRVNRKGFDGTDGEWSSFGSAPYAREELVAEMGAAFLCGHAGIENKTIDNSAAYIKSWLGRLKNDAKFVITAAAQAQKAVNYILNKKYTEN